MEIIVEFVVGMVEIVRNAHVVMCCRVIGLECAADTFRVEGTSCNQLVGDFSLLL